ncbi:MAG: hypothetical protein ABIJ91_02560 [Candidatus Kuenenbacteria bacterium]
MRENTLPSKKDILVRHADKGKWTIDKGELKSDPRLKQDEVELIMSVLDREFNDLKETPLVKDGLIRSVKLGEKQFTEITNHPEFKQAGNKAVMIAMDSGRDRAQLTRALATNRTAQLEDQYNKDKSEDEQMRIDILHLEAEDIAKMMADSDDSTWGPYGKMIEKGATEAEAVLQWLKDMNQPDSGVDPAIHPKESGERYKNIIQQIHKRVNVKDVPMFIFGVGHSGSLGQLKYEKMGDQMTAEDSPTFCEMHGFDKDGNLLNTKRVDI